MSEIPSGWFDDPEDPTLLRYWDGNQWTEHRTPKASDPLTESGDGAGSLIADSFRLALDNWPQLLAIWALSLLGFIAGIIALAVGAIGALSPGLFTILDRLTDDDTDDEAFLDSISLDPNAGFWFMVAVAAILIIGSTAVQYGASISRLASHLSGESLSVSQCLRRSFRQAPRWVGIYLLWLLGLAGLSIIASIVVAIAAQVPITLVVAIPALLAAAVIAYPIIWMAPTALLAGPVGQPPLRTVLRLYRGGWGPLALRVLLIHLVIIGVFIVGGIIGIIPILGQLLGLATSWVVTSFSLAASLLLYRQAEGQLAPELTNDA